LELLQLNLSKDQYSKGLILPACGLSFPWNPDSLGEFPLVGNSWSNQCRPSSVQWCSSVFSHSSAWTYDDIDFRFVRYIFS